MEENDEKKKKNEKKRLDKEALCERLKKDSRKRVIWNGTKKFIQVKDLIIAIHALRVLH